MIKIIPLDVPKNMHKEFMFNYNLATKNTGRFMLFAGDQKIEHLNDDFYGKNISEDDADPEHLFRIASKATIGAFATQYGLLTKYGKDYNKVPYIVKINSKTNLGNSEPLSQSLVDFEDIIALKQHLKIVGIGYTIYLGSEHESFMLAEAGRYMTWAHQNGLFTILWMYPRGKFVKNEKSPHIIAGAAGVGCCLGADFVKVNYPEVTNAAIAFKEAVKAAGKTKVITAGGVARNVRQFLQETHDQIHVSGAHGSATGRNIHQKSFDEAVRMCNAISAITYYDKSVDYSYNVFMGKTE